jgi:hypothetical protein
MSFYLYCVNFVEADDNRINASVHWPTKMSFPSQGIFVQFHW